MIARQFTIGGTGGLVKKNIEVGHAAEVFIIKQMAIGSTIAEYNSLLKKFKNKYAEFLSGSDSRSVVMQPIIKLVTSASLPSKEPFTSLNGSTVETTHGLIPQVDKRYSDLLSVGIVDLEKPTWVIRIRSSKQLGLEDVMSIGTNQTVNGGSSANVTLKNNLYKYTFQDQSSLDFGLPVFSPDDIIVVQTEKLENNNLETIFTGYVNKVTKSRAPAENSIILMCEDASKRLRYSRVLIGKGVTDEDSQAQLLPLSAFVMPWPSETKSGGSAGPESPHKILKDIFVLALTNIDSESSIILTKILFENEFKKFNSPSATITNLPASMAGQTKTVSSDEEISLQKIGTYRNTIEKARNDLLGKNGYFWRNVSNNRVEIYKNPITFLKANSIIDNGRGFINKRPIAIIYGTDQPAFQLSFVNSFNFWISEWKEAHRVANEFAEVVNFEFFCDESGIVKFRPVNMSLDLLKNKTSNLNYKIRDEYIYREETSEDNTGIINVMYITGEYRLDVGTPGEEIGLVAVIKDNKLIQQFGTKMGNPLTCVGLTTKSALKIFGRSKMERINSRAFSDGTVEMLSDPNIKVGNYIHLPETGAIYYVSDLRHDYVVGQKYRMNLDLTYRRRPIYDLASRLSIGSGFSSFSSTASKGLAKRSLDLDFNQSVGSTVLLSVYNAVISALVGMGYDSDEIKKVYKQTNLQEFYYYGYIWEPAVNIDFKLAAEVQAKEQSDIAASETKAQNTKALATIRDTSPSTVSSLPTVAST
jgi:hypothetical protein